MCIITVDDIVGIGPGPEKIRVFGTVEDCGDLLEDQTVLVDVACGGGSGPFVMGVPANIDSNGEDWDVVVTVTPDSGCACGGIVTATARCGSDDSCSGTLTVPELRCPDCPEVQIIANEPGAIECNPDGTASVPLEAKIINNSPNAVIAFIECGPDGALDPASSAPSVGVNSGESQIVDAICRYPTPSSPEPFIRFTDFGDNEIGCPNVPFAPFEVDCNCPEVVNLLAEVEGCFARFSGTLTPAGVQGCEFKWEFGDGAEATTTVPDVEHTYSSNNPNDPDGFWAVSVTVQCPNCDSTETTTVIARITDCTPVGACCLPDGTCEIMTEANCTAREGVYKGDGSSCDECTSDDECGKPTEALAIAQAILLSGLLVLNMLRFCLEVEIPTWLYWLLTGLAVAPLLIYLIYEGLCAAGVIEPECCFNSCDRYFMAWIPLVSGAIVALYLQRCCPGWVWWAIVGGLAALGLYMFYRWIKVCGPSRCDILSAWGLVIISGVPTAFLIIKTLTDWTKWIDPAIQNKLKDCPHEWVEIAVVLAGIVIYIFVFRCKNQDEAPETDGAEMTQNL